MLYWFRKQLTIGTSVLILLVVVFTVGNLDRKLVSPAQKPGANFIASQAFKPGILISHALTIPSGLKAVATLQHTAWVGTADHPTINGGMINAADGMPISHNAPVIKATPAFGQSSSIAKQSIVPIQKGFDDSWATSQRVKNFLKEAASEGKLDYVLNKSDEMALPASVSIVPMIESDYKSNAISSKGAGGPWQIMPATASGLGITSEQRFQWEPATQAALNYLNQLHKEFGNWNLAFAAYNAGPFRVQEALQKNPHAASLEELDLPLETKQYVIHMQEINDMLVKYSKNELATNES